MLLLNQKMQLRVLLALALSGGAAGCSNLLITPGATVDGSAMLSYNADSGTLYGSLYHYAAATHATVREPCRV